MYNMLAYTLLENSFFYIDFFFVFSLLASLIAPSPSVGIFLSFFFFVQLCNYKVYFFIYLETYLAVHV